MKSEFKLKGFNFNIMKKMKNIKIKIRDLFQNLFSIFTPFITFFPISNLWHGLMSMPFIAYIIYLISNGTIELFIENLFFYLPIIIILFVIFTLITYCMFFLYKNKKNGLVTNGPYTWVRNPQYSLVILFISILNYHCLVNTSKIVFNVDNYFASIVLFFIIWIGEILIYIGLALIEEHSLRKIYKEEYEKYEIWAGRFFFKFKKLYSIISKEKNIEL